ncbi:AMP-binding protein [Auritidibacter ignavus]|uniref:AMP-binding protein n=1 Tax=Auritidibacter TaxID=1160973 RepID=UPI000D728B8F|nr:MULTISPECIES: AMP-binding protein [Auritidibacter]PXA81612.1 propionyl-CoA synthetase [Auritidibacter sp. NML120779]PXA79909.1 propionyl-CoA synthetase [Auritidibacter sp. NML120636]WGH80581.1 AMP-binding protein [Auritidibacter ignavus]WGH86058.1 AMP-binding protein [Auritidibacter ignavus]WGH88343.1 AMP-binding protein [Auritidibacter ignavus]
MNQQVTTNQTYQDVYRYATDHPEQFWLENAASLQWEKAPSVAVEQPDEFHWRWFPDGEINITVQALDRHVAAGHGDRIAIYYDSAVTGDKRAVTYQELLEEVAQTAGALQDLGVTRGDRVLIYMPMIPEAAVAMLACARLGAIHVVTFGGFAAKEITTRMDDTQPKVVLTASGGIERTKQIPYLPPIKAAIESGEHQPEYVIVKKRPQFDEEARDFDPSWLDWDETVATASAAEAVPVASCDPLYLLHTSGTTSKPKAVMRDQGGYATALEWSMPRIYDLHAGEVAFVASDIGWVVGHSHIIYGPLITGASTVLYEGKPVGTPDAGAFWRVAEEYGAKMLYAAPTAFRAIRKEDPRGEEVKKYDLSRLENVFSVGERLDEATYHWIVEITGKPVVDHWWQTETGWPVAANPRGLEKLPFKPGSPTVPMPGFQVSIVDAAGEPVAEGMEGNIVIKLPLPPGALIGLWNEEDRFKRSYLETFPGYYLTGDTGFIDEDGYIFVLGRSDDVINVAGHRLSTGTLEGLVAEHDAVAECAVIGVADELKGQKPVAYVVLADGAEISQDQLAEELIAKVRSDFGAVAAFRDVEIVSALPKTRSGKILRRTMRDIVEGKEYNTPSTIENASVLDSFGQETTRLNG